MEGYGRLAHEALDRELAQSGQMPANFLFLEFKTETAFGDQKASGMGKAVHLNHGAGTSIRTAPL